MKNNLNTFKYDDEKQSDFIETLYTQTENSFWPYFDKIIATTHKDEIQLLEKMNIFFFLLFLHWRLPKNTERAREYSEKMFTEKGFDFVKIVGPKDEIDKTKKITELIKNHPDFVKVVKTFLPFSPFYNREEGWSEKLLNWRFLYTEDKESWWICGDSPIIIPEKNNHNPNNCLDSFVFAISGRILIVATEKPIKKGTSGKLWIEHGNAVIEKSERFIVCKSKERLTTLVNFHKMYVKHGQTHTIVPELFETLEKLT